MRAFGMLSTCVLQCGVEIVTTLTRFANTAQSAAVQAILEYIIPESLLGDVPLSASCLYFFLCLLVL